MMTDLYDHSGRFRGVNAAGTVAWGAGAIAFFAAGTRGGTIPALAISVVVYVVLRRVILR
jgi:hypothetical protein